METKIDYTRIFVMCKPTPELILKAISDGATVEFIKQLVDEMNEDKQRLDGGGWFDKNKATLFKRVDRMLLHSCLYLTETGKLVYEYENWSWGTSSLGCKALFPEAPGYRIATDEDVALFADELECKLSTQYDFPEEEKV